MAWLVTHRAGTEIWATVPSSLELSSTAVCKRGKHTERTVPEVTQVVQERRGTEEENGVWALASSLYLSVDMAPDIVADFWILISALGNAASCETQTRTGIRTTNGTGEGTQLARTRY